MNRQKTIYLLLNPLLNPVLIAIETNPINNLDEFQLKSFD